MSDRYIIVVRKEGDQSHGRIYTGRNMRRLILKITRNHCRRKLIDWTAEMLTYVDENYRLGKKQAMAARLSEMSGQHVTKNAVISKAHSRGITMRRNPEGDTYGR